MLTSLIVASISNGLKNPWHRCIKLKLQAILRTIAKNNSKRESHTPLHLVFSFRGYTRARGDFFSTGPVTFVTTYSLRVFRLFGTYDNNLISENVQRSRYDFAIDQRNRQYKVKKKIKLK